MTPEDQDAMLSGKNMIGGAAAGGPAPKPPMPQAAKAMEIFLPPELLPFEADLRMFFDMMVLKLRLNKSKGFAEGVHPVDMLNMLDAEFIELRDALLHKSQEEVLAEAADVGNMAWLCALAAIRMDKPEYKRYQKGLPK